MPNPRLVSTPICSMLLIALCFQLALVVGNQDHGPNGDDETYLTAADFEAGERIPLVPNKTIDDSGMYTEEDDMDIDSITETDTVEGSVREKRNIVRARGMRWPNGEVPYAISSDLTENERAMVAAVFAWIERVSCVRFIAKNTQEGTDYIHIIHGSKCRSVVGKRGGRQSLILGAGCYERGIIMHELLHALGFIHEHNRPDRDEYVTIHTENIRDGSQGNFVKFSAAVVSMIGPYDYSSLMHYKSTAFGKLDGWRQPKITMELKHPGVEIGQRIGMSVWDISRLIREYPCPNTTPAPIPTTTPIPADCVDTLGGECQYIKEQRRCDEFKIWCRRTCEQCDVCEDVTGCETAQQYKLCTKRETRLGCPHACGLCNGVPPPDCTIYGDMGEACKEERVRDKCQQECERHPHGGSD